MDPSPPWRIGLSHQSCASTPVPTLQSYGYNFTTSPITTAAFHSRVLALLSSSLSANSSQSLPDEEQEATPDTHPKLSPLTSSDALLKPSTRGLAATIGVVSPWIDLCSPDRLISDLSCQVLLLEARYAAFCGVSSLLVPAPRFGMPPGSEILVKYARLLLEVVEAGPYMQVLIPLPLRLSSEPSALEMIGSLGPFARQQRVRKAGSEGVVVGLFNELDIWDLWNFVRDVCGYHPRLGIALQMSPKAPVPELLHRWFAEPIRLIYLCGSDFLPNLKGFPVLDRFIRDYLYRLMGGLPQPSILLSSINQPIPSAQEFLPTKIPSNGTLLSFGAFENSSSTGSTDLSQLLQDPTPAEASTLLKQVPPWPVDPTPHLTYLRWAEKNRPDPTPSSMFGLGFQDFLQNPLQPLTDNLESITYEVFEKDPIKYAWYEKAITLALLDWQAMARPTSGPAGSVTVVVVGAGRGPLVTRALRAAQAAGVSIDLWAVEKNPNAFVILEGQNDDSYDLLKDPPGWAGRVHLVQEDMRTWRGPKRLVQTAGMEENEFLGNANGGVMRSNIDILISELLGSFADNELSPECLDGVAHLMGPQSISIPEIYSAHISPITTPRIYADLMLKAASGLSNALMTPYVVMLHSHCHPSTTPVQTAWVFKHREWPSDDERKLNLAGNAHNERFCIKKFSCPSRGVIHGIAGYFEAVLYGDVELSTRPDTIDTKSKDMSSWFPMFFPLKTPLAFPDSSELQITMWRKTDGRKVWYEWLVDVLLVLQSRRSAETGKRIRLSNSGLHSSVGSAMIV